MNSVVFFHIFTFLRNFNPGITMLTPYLIKNKEFSNSDVHEKLTPWFFGSSLVVSLLSLIIMNTVGVRDSIIFNTMCDVAVFGLFLGMNKGSVWAGALGCVLHGLSTSLMSVSKSIINELVHTDISRKHNILVYNTVRKTASVMAGVLAQDIFFSCGNNVVNMYTGILFLVVALGCGFCITKTEINPKDNLLLKIKAYGLIPTLTQILRKEVIFPLTILTLASSLYLSFVIFSSNIFIEKKKNQDVGSAMLGKILYKISLPMRAISFLLIKFFSIFDSTITYNPQFDKNTLVFGYISSLSKFIAIAITYLTLKKSYTPLVFKILDIFLVIITILLTFSLSYTKGLTLTYITYMAGFASSSMLLQLNQTKLAQEKHFKDILCLSTFFSCLIHVLISILSTIKKYTATKKMLLYMYISIILFIFSLFFIRA